MTSTVPARVAPAKKPGMPNFTARFTYLLGNVKWEERGRIRNFDKASFARVMTLRGFPVSAQYVGDLANGVKNNPSGHFLYVAGDVFSEYAKLRIGARYFFDEDWERRVNATLARQNIKLERNLLNLSMPMGARRR